MFDVDDPAHLSSREAIDALLRVQQERARLDALEVQLLVAAATRQEVADEYVLLDRICDDERVVIIRDAVRDEIAAATRWSARTTQCRIDLARLLTESLPATVAALREGAISMGHARVIADHAMTIPEESRQALEERVLVVARRNTLSATRQAARRAVLARSKPTLGGGARWPAARVESGSSTNSTACPPLWPAWPRSTRTLFWPLLTRRLRLTIAASGSANAEHTPSQVSSSVVEWSPPTVLPPTRRCAPTSTSSSTCQSSSPCAAKTASRTRPLNYAATS